MEISHAAAAAAGGAGPGSAAAPAERPTPYDIAAFDAARERAAVAGTEAAPSAQAPAPVGGGGFDYALRLLSNLNASPHGLTATSSANGTTAALSPSEMLSLTVQAHQFLFQSQLTANVANRTSDGVQQLFRQQS